MEFAQTTAQGRVLNTPDIRKTNKGKDVCNFQLRVSRPTAPGRTQEDRTFYVSVIGTNAPRCYSVLRPGDEVTVTGEVYAVAQADGRPLLHLRVDFIRFSQAVLDCMQ